MEISPPTIKNGAHWPEGRWPITMENSLPLNQPWIVYQLMKHNTWTLENYCFCTTISPVSSAVIIHLYKCIKVIHSEGRIIWNKHLIFMCIQLQQTYFNIGIIYDKICYLLLRWKFLFDKFTTTDMLLKSLIKFWTIIITKHLKKINNGKLLTAHKFLILMALNVNGRMIVIRLHWESD